MLGKLPLPLAPPALGVFAALLFPTAPPYYLFKKFPFGGDD